GVTPHDDDGAFVVPVLVNGRFGPLRVGHAQTTSLRGLPLVFGGCGSGVVGVVAERGLPDPAGEALEVTFDDDEVAVAGRFEGEDARVSVVLMELVLGVAFGQRVVGGDGDGGVGCIESVDMGAHGRSSFCRDGSIWSVDAARERPRRSQCGTAQGRREPTRTVTRGHCANGLASVWLG